MRPRVPVLAVGLAALVIGAAPAAATACGKGFSVVRPALVSVEQVSTIDAVAEDAGRIEVDWGDGARSAEPVVGGGASALHLYRRPGPLAITVVAVCGPADRETRSAPVRLAADVLPRCVTRRGRSVLQPDCDQDRGSLVINDDGGQAPADWLDAPCRDNDSQQLVGPPGDPPRARAAACSLPEGDEGGPVYTRAGTTLTLRFGVPARTVGVRVGTRRSPAARRLRGVRQVGSSGTLWRVRIPRDATPQTTRLVVVAVRAGQADQYASRLSLRR